MIKIKAFLIHLFISAVIVLSFLSLVFFIWYPSPYLEMEGGYAIIAMLVGVALVLGPLLTFIVYKPGKKGLIFDLYFIALVQIAAFTYGAHAIFTERPQYVAFVVGQFRLIPASMIKTEELKIPSLDNGVLSKPKFVYVEMPEDTDKHNEIVFSAMAGKDAELYPELYREYEDFSHIITADIKHQLSLDNLIKRYPSIENKIKTIEKDYKTTREQLIFYPILGKEKSFIMVLSKQDAGIIEILKFSPWEDNL